MMSIAHEKSKHGHQNLLRQKPANKHNLNHQIKSPQIRVIFDGVENGMHSNANGEANGTANHKSTSIIMSLHDALKKAESLKVDLIEINPKATPPICKLMDYGKFLYRSQKSTKREKKSRAKELGFHVNIANHDFETKMRQARGFLEENCPITFKIQFRGRECAHKEIGLSLFAKVTTALEKEGRKDGDPKINGKFAILRICPLSKNR